MTGLTLHNVSVLRGQRSVLGGIDVAFEPGRLTAVVGPNGAGKSTMLDVATGLLSPTSGQVRFGDVPIADIPRRELARRRAYLPQSPRVDWAISVERVVALGLTSHLPAFGDLPGHFQPRIDAAIARYNLGDLRDRPATQLSGGELARVMLARATVSEPELLIVDEPTAGLDPRHAIDAGQRLRELADGGCTVAVALHDLSLAIRIADDVIAMRGGRVVAQGPADAIFTEATLRELYDVRTRIVRDADGVAIRFLD